MKFRSTLSCFLSLDIYLLVSLTTSIPSVVLGSEPLFSLENGASVFNTPSSGGTIQIKLPSVSNPVVGDGISENVEIEVDLSELSDLTSNAVDVDFGFGDGPIRFTRDNYAEADEGSQRRVLRRVQDIRADFLENLDDSYAFKYHNDFLPPNGVFDEEDPTQIFQYFNGKAKYEDKEAILYVKKYVDPNGNSGLAGSLITTDIEYKFRMAPGTDKSFVFQVDRSSEPGMPQPLPPEDDPEYEEVINSNVRRIEESKIKRSKLHNTNRRTQSDDGSVLDIVVAYTLNALCQSNGQSYPCDDIDPAQHLNAIHAAEEAVMKTNEAYVNSGIETQLRLVYVHYTADVNDAAYSCGNLLGAVTRQDGVMDEVRDKRNEWGADFVALLTSTSIGGGCAGVAWLGPHQYYMYSLTMMAYASGGVFAHEVGHNFGCEHDRLNASPGKPYQYGWQDPDAEFRTIMAYGCPKKWCRRINFFSNPTKRHNGKIMGNSANDCARQHNEVRERVATYRKARITNAPTISSPPSTSSAPSITPTKIPTFSPTVSREPSLAPTTSIEPSGMPSEYPTFSIADLDSFQKLRSPGTTSFQVQHGIMFDVVAKDVDVTIHNFRIPFLRAGNVTISLWSKDGSFWYEKNNPEAWQLLGSPVAYSPGMTLENPVPLPIRSGNEYGFDPIVVAAGTTKGIFITINETSPNLNLIGMDRKSDSFCASTHSEPFDFPVWFENDDLAVYEGIYKDNWNSHFGTSSESFRYLGTVLYKTTRALPITPSPTMSPAPTLSLIPSVSLVPTAFDFSEIATPTSLDISALDGIMFEVQSKSQNILLRNMKLTLYSVSPELSLSMVNLTIFSAEDSFYDESIGDSLDRSAWTERGTSKVTASQNLQSVLLPENSFEPIFVEKGKTVGIFITIIDPLRNHKILARKGSSIKSDDFENADILIREGIQKQWELCDNWAVSLTDTNGSPHPIALLGSLLYSTEGTSIPTSSPSDQPSGLPSISFMPTLSMTPSSAPSTSRFPSLAPSDSPSLSDSPSPNPTKTPAPTPERLTLETRTADTGNSAFGLMFDIVASRPVRIHGFTLSQMQDYPMNIKIFSRIGSHYYAYDDASKWEEIQSYKNFTGGGSDTLAVTSLSFPAQFIGTDSTRAFYIAITETYGEIWPLLGGILPGTNYRDGIWANDTNILLMEGVKFYGISEENPFGSGTLESGIYMHEGPGGTSFNMKGSLIEYSLATTIMPSLSPSSSFSPSLSAMPSSLPSGSVSPSLSPSLSLSPSGEPSSFPSTSSVPSVLPSSAPSMAPSISMAPSLNPSISQRPSSQPSGQPSSAPSGGPSANPSLSIMPSKAPSAIPSFNPSVSFLPTLSPSVSVAPSLERVKLISSTSGRRSGAFGAMFEITAKRSIIVNTFSVLHFGGNGFNYHVYTKPGSWNDSGAYDNANAWTKLGSATFSSLSSSSNNPVTLPSQDFDTVTLNSGETQSFYIACVGNYFRVHEEIEGTIVENDDVSIAAGLKKYPYDGLFQANSNHGLGSTKYMFQGSLIYSYAVEPPSESPSYPPSHKPSVFPSLSPSQIFQPSVSPSSSNDPSKAPSSLPSPSPTDNPSGSPTSSIAPSPDLFSEAVIQITVPSSIQLSGFNIPTSQVQLETVIEILANTLKTAMSARLDNPQTQKVAGVRILSINGQAIDSTFTFRARHLQTITTVEYELILEELCSTSECTDSQAVANALYELATESMREEIDNGSLQTILQTNAQSENVESLLAASVESGDFSDTVVPIIELLSAFYPDWNGGGHCLNDGNEPEYMTNNPSLWMSNTREGCCEQYFSWDLEACMSTGGDSVTSDLVWYPDWGGSEKCINDGNEPTYMSNNRDSWMYSTKKACCERYYGWEPSKCDDGESISSGPITWYVDWQSYKCKQNCATSDGINCGGFAEAWDHLHDSAAACCKNMIPWVATNDCTPSGAR